MTVIVVDKPTTLKLISMYFKLEEIIAELKETKDDIAQGLDQDIIAEDVEEMISISYAMLGAVSTPLQAAGPMLGSEADYFEAGDIIALEDDEDDDDYTDDDDDLYGFDIPPQGYDDGADLEYFEEGVYDIPGVNVGEEDEEEDDEDEDLEMYSATSDEESEEDDLSVIDEDLEFEEEFEMALEEMIGAN